MQDLIVSWPDAWACQKASHSPPVTAAACRLPPAAACRAPLAAAPRHGQCRHRHPRRPQTHNQSPPKALAERVRPCLSTQLCRRRRPRPRRRPASLRLQANHSTAVTYIGVAICAGLALVMALFVCRHRRLAARRLALGGRGLGAAPAAPLTSASPAGSAAVSSLARPPVIIMQPDSTVSFAVKDVEAAVGTGSKVDLATGHRGRVRRHRQWRATALGLEAATGR